MSRRGAPDLLEASMVRSIRDALSARAGQPDLAAPVDDDPDFVEACLDFTRHPPGGVPPQTEGSSPPVTARHSNDALDRNPDELAEALVALAEARARETQLRHELEALQATLSDAISVQTAAATELQEQQQRNALIATELATANAAIARHRYAYADQRQLIAERDHEISELRASLLAAEERREQETAAILETLRTLQA